MGRDRSRLVWSLKGECVAKVIFPSFLESEFKSYFLTAYDLFLFAIAGAIAKMVSENEMVILVFAGSIALINKLISKILPRGFLIFFIMNYPAKILGLFSSITHIKTQIISTTKRGNMDFPITSINENAITVRSGDSTLFFEMFPPDLEQLNPSQRSLFFNDVITRLGRLPENEFTKIYFFNDRFFISSKTPLHIPSIELLPCSNPLLPIFNTTDFYTDILIFDDFFKANLKYHRIVSILGFPANEIDECHLMQFGNFSLFFQKIAKAKAENSLGKQISINSQGSNSGKNNLVAEKTYGQANSALSEIIDGTLSYFKTEILFYIDAESLLELNEKTKSLLIRVKDDGFSFIVESIGLRSILYHAFPGVAPLFINPLTDIRSRKMPTDFLVNLLPLTKDTLDKGGIEFFSRSGLPILFNPLDKNTINFNMIISGESGQGKSFLACALVEYFYKHDVKLIVLDKGQSFVRLARYYGASNFSQKFNPVQFLDVDYLKAFVMSVLPKKDFEELNEGIIYKTIKSSLENGTLNSFDDLMSSLKAPFPEIDNYFEEIKGHFTSENINISNFTYIDCTLVPKKLLAPMLIFLMKLTRSLSGTKRFVIDEAWDVLGAHSNYVAQMARESRKEGCGLITITQNLHDFFRDGGDELARVIVENSNYKITLYQNLTDKARFTPYQEEIIRNLKSVKDEYSEFAIFSNRSQKVARFVASCLQYELFNTEEQRRSILDKWLVDHLPYFPYAESIDRFVRVAYA